MSVLALFGAQSGRGINDSGLGMQSTLVLTALVCGYVEIKPCAGVQGSDMVEMVKAFEWLKDEVINHDHDVCFVGDTVDILFHAQHMLSDRLVKMTPPPHLAAAL